MKNLRLLLLLPFILFASCKKNKKPDDCGCDGKIVKTIADTEQLIGTITYKKQLEPNDNDYNNTFRLSYNTESCANCGGVLILCNEDILSSDIKELKNLPVGTEFSVRFSGHLRELCNLSFDIPERPQKEHITLTKIEKIEGQ